MKTPITFARGQDTKRLLISDYRRAADKYKLELAHVQAVVKVEAGSAGFWNSGDMKLLYEGHIAYRETTGKLRDELVKAGLAWASWGDVPYGNASLSRERLRLAIEIAGAKAYRWASYGLGQIMGFNAEICGYGSARIMFETFLKGEPAQLDGMLRFIRANGLLTALRNKDWHKFAKGYNGSAYATHGYHTRLEKAYREALLNSAEYHERAEVTVDAWADGILTIGDKGQAVEDLQKRLVELGAEIEIDGHFGRATAQAVSNFQKDAGLKVDGIVGQVTEAALAPKPKPKPKPTIPPMSTKTALGAGGLVGLLWAIFELFVG